eukprot:7286257-Lingulodinium_polyedra.AAC.1
MEGACGSQQGSAGCSSMAKPPRMMTSVAVDQANRMRRLAMISWRPCLAESAGTPHGSSRVRSGGGPPGLRLATLHVSHGGPATTPMTRPAAILSCQNCLTWGLLISALQPP